MSWYRIMNGQLAWRDVVPTRKRANRPRGQARPDLPKLDWRARKRLAAEDRVATRPLGRDDDDGPKKRRRTKRDLVTDKQKSFLLVSFLTACWAKPGAETSRCGLEFFEWSKLYRAHQLSSTAAMRILREAGLELIEKGRGRRVWSLSNKSLLVARLEACDH